MRNVFAVEVDLDEDLYFFSQEKKRVYFKEFSKLWTRENM